MKVSINDIEKVGRNLFNYDGRYYCMFATGITPNGCWLINPVLRELVDIEPSTGIRVYGEGVLEFDGIVGTVPAFYEFIKYSGE